MAREKEILRVTVDLSAMTYDNLPPIDIIFKSERILILDYSLTDDINMAVLLEDKIQIIDQFSTSIIHELKICEL